MSLDGSLWMAMGAGLLLGFVLAWVVSLRRNAARRHADEVRLRRRVADAQHELDAQRARHAKANDDAQQRQQTLERALAESEETVALLSDEKLPAFEAELQLRNRRILELDREVSVLRARVADAKDEHETVARQLESAALELEQHAAEREQFAASRAALQRLETEIHTLKQALERARSTIEELRGGIAERDTQLVAIRELERKVDELRAAVARRDDALREAHREAQARSSQLARLREELEIATGRGRQQQQLLQARTDRIAHLETESVARSADRDKLRREVASLRAELPNLQGLISAGQQTIAELRARIGAYEKQVPDYEAALRSRNEHIARLDRDFTALQQQLPTLNDALRERESSIEDLISELGRQRRRTAELQARLASHREQRAAHRDAKVIELHQHRAGEAGEKATGTTTFARRPGADNLRRIRGIGPAVERALNRGGIFRFAQLAALTDDQVCGLEQQMPGIGKRLARYDWLAQARELAGGSSGGIRSGG